MIVVDVHGVLIEARRTQGEDIRGGSVGCVLGWKEELDEEPSVLLLGILVNGGGELGEKTTHLESDHVDGWTRSVRAASQTTRRREP